MQDFVQSLGQQSPKHPLRGMPDFYPRPANSRREFVFSVESSGPRTPQVLPPRRLPADDGGSLPPSSPPQSSPTPQPHSPGTQAHPVTVPQPTFTLPPPTSYVQAHATMAELAGPPRLRLPNHHAQPPVFSLRGTIPAAGEDSDPNGGVDEDDAPRISRADKGKGRATDIDTDTLMVDENDGTVADEVPRFQGAQKGTERVTDINAHGLLANEDGDKTRGGNANFAAAFADAIAAAAATAASGGDYFSSIGQWIIPEVEDEDSLSPEGLVDKQLELLEEAVRKTMGELPATPPPAQDGPANGFDFDLHRVKGCSGAEMRRITHATRTRAQRMRGIAHRRAQLERDLHFLRCQAEHMAMLEKVIASKRLWLEQQMNMLGKAFRMRSKSGEGNGSDGHGGGDESNGSGAGGSRGKSTGGNDDGKTRSEEGNRAEQNVSGDKDWENEDGNEENWENESGSDKENTDVHGTGVALAGSKVVQRDVAPPVAASQRATRRTAHRVQRLPSLGPSISQAAAAAPTLLPAWNADALQGTGTGWELSSDSGSSPSPGLPLFSARLRSPQPNPFTPPPRSSASIRHNMESARTPLSDLPGIVASLPSTSVASRAVEASPLASLSQLGGARRVSLTGAFALSAPNEHPLFGAGFSSISARAGESISQCMPGARRQLAEDGAGTPSFSFLSRDAAMNDECDE